jgi:hypothetical protein
MSLSALEFGRAEQEARQELILFFECVRGLLLSGRVWRGRMSRSFDQKIALGITLGGLRLGVL